MTWLSNARNANSCARTSTEKLSKIAVPPDHVPLRRPTPSSCRCPRP
ncbi:MAG: hypothetical protein M0C28_31705 [Candidatus Moduliflexus flocculans]|nr:hypothetical protein [Candidatus Moduliflexus flocculans]